MNLARPSHLDTLPDQERRLGRGIDQLIRRSVRTEWSRSAPCRRILGNTIMWPKHPRPRRELARLVRDEHIYRKNRFARFEQRGERRRVDRAFRERVETANRNKEKWDAGRDGLNR